MRPRLGAVLVAAMVLGAAPACGEAPSRSPDQIEVVLEHSRFVTEPLEFEIGDTVTFVVRNTDPIDHEFILGDEEIQAIHETGTGHHHGRVPGEVSVPAGAERTTSYTFSRAGTLVIGCHLPGHYDYGMRTEVRVTG